MCDFTASRCVSPCNGKLTFPLCRSCVETQSPRECSQQISDRQFTGTYVADKLWKVIEKQYKARNISEAREYKVVQHDRDSISGGLFWEYANSLLKIKQECSGWPSWCLSELEKDRYINNDEEIILDEQKICKNVGLISFVFKIMLNSFWGKFGQRENAQQTQFIHDPCELFKMVTNSSLIVWWLTGNGLKKILRYWNRQTLLLLHNS